MFTLEFSKEDLEVLDKAIQQLPFYLAAPLLQKINEQLKPKEEPAQPTE